MASVLRLYNAALIRRPMATQCATAAFLFGAGDVIAQQGVEKKGWEHDFSRTARITFYGGCLFGPVITKWFDFLNRIKFSSPTRATVSRVFLDQAVLTPAAVAFFFGSMSVLEGKPNEAIPRIQAAYVPTLIRNWGVFIPVQAINFSIVPPHLRFVVVSVVNLFWNTYLSIANARTKNGQEIAEVAEVTEKKIMPSD
ncbi:Protein required for ethanol metabolism [Stygiomarasmius scandens]|uniref:Protein required for ethanol metabolism n=1 Tax=Marasmiellus scandens TaxID=2682957 RepID=A0ABR1J4Q1_9AGAR